MKFLVIMLVLINQAIAGNTDGGGGRGVVCYNPDNTIKSVELLDLYEGRILEGLTPDTFADKTPLEILDLVISKNPHNGVKDSFEYSKKLYSSFRFLPEGVRLEPIDDSGEIFIPANCKIEQLANMQSLTKVFVVGDFWNKMNNVNKAALIVHEYLWAIQRIAGREFSSRARRDTARYLASNYSFTKKYPSVKVGMLSCGSANLDHQINKITSVSRFTVSRINNGYRLEFGRIGGIVLQNNHFSEVDYVDDVFSSIEKEIYTADEVLDYDSGEFTIDVEQENQGQSFMITFVTSFKKLNDGTFQKEIVLKVIDSEFPDKIIKESPIYCDGIRLDEIDIYM